MKRIVSRILILLLVVNVFGSYGGTQAAKAAENHASVSYRTHCQTYGWLDYVKDGALSGTEGQAKRLESIQIQVDSNLSGSIEYSVHCQTFGWMPYEKDGAQAGTTGLKKRLESIKIRLTGELAETYDVVYRVHRQTYGWTDWVKNDTPCGTTGQAKRLEAIQIKLVEKNATPVASVSYRTHCQTYGWLNYVKDGASSGTEGQAKRLEAIQILVDSNYTGGVTYSVHCQTYGWMDWKTNATVAGTSGQAKRLEAIKISLTGELAEKFDVYYRVHSQTFGWLDWAKNGEVAGTSGLSKRLESIQIRLVTKGNAAPGETTRPYVTKDILNQQTGAQNPSTPSGGYDKPGTPTTSTDIKDILNSAQLKSYKTNVPEIDQKVDQILAQIITPDMDTYSKTVAIWNYIIQNTTYDGSVYPRHTYSFVSKFDTWCVNQSKDVLLDGRGTCVGYASAFVVLTRRIGLCSNKVCGRYAGGSHTWVNVNINGTQYSFDPQIGQKAIQNDWGGQFDFFCKTDSQWGSQYVYGDSDGDRDAYLNGFGGFVRK